MRRMLATKFINWVKSLSEHVAQNENTTEVGGNLEVDGVVYADKIKDRVGREGGVHTTIDLGTNDISTNANVNIGESENPKDLYVSGKAKLGNLFLNDNFPNLRKVTINDNEGYNIEDLIGDPAQYNAIQISTAINSTPSIIFPDDCIFIIGNLSENLSAKFEWFSYISNDKSFAILPETTIFIIKLGKMFFISAYIEF